MINEEWRDVVGFEGLYRVSSVGRVISVLSWNGRPGNRLMLLNINDGGYPYTLLTKNKVRKTFTAHRLVAMAFIPLVKGKRFVNHKNGVKTDNRVENLEWCTIKENNRHAIATGLVSRPKGSLSGSAVLNEDTVLQIFNSCNTTYELAEQYGVHQSTVACIKRGKSWAHITGKTYSRKRGYFKVKYNINSKLKQMKQP